MSSGSSEWPGIPGHSLLERVRISGAVGGQGAPQLACHTAERHSAGTVRVDSPATFNVPAQPSKAYASRGSRVCEQEACQFYWRDSCGGNVPRDTYRLLTISR